VLKSLQYDSALHFIIVEWECNSAIKAGLTLKSLMWTQISISTWWLRQNHCSESGVGIASIENDQDGVFWHLFRPPLFQHFSNVASGWSQALTRGLVTL